MSEQRMKHRIWADLDEWGRGWIGRFTTARGVRTVTEPKPSIEAAKLAAAEEMCRVLDEEPIRLPPPPARGCKTFAVSRNGRRARLAPIG